MNLATMQPEAVIDQASETGSPLLAGEAVRPIKRILTSEIIGLWDQCFDIDISQERLSAYEHVELLEGVETGIRFFTPSDTDGTSKFYEDFHKHKLANFPPGYYSEARWEHRLAASRLTADQKVIEIGSGGGGFLNACRDNGVDAFGIEINAAAVENAKSLGFNVEEQHVDEAADRYPEQFDCVCAFQVLEHIAEPMPFLDAALRMLKPGGRLVIAVPNADSFLGKQHNVLDMPPHHMLQWTERSLRSAGEILEMQVELVKREPLAKIHVPGYVQVQLRKQDRLFDRLPLRFQIYLQRCGQTIVSKGIHRMLTGQTIYVEYQKKADA